MTRFAISALLVEFDRAKAYTDALWGTSQAMKCTGGPMLTSARSAGILATKRPSRTSWFAI